MRTHCPVQTLSQRMHSPSALHLLSVLDTSTHSLHFGPALQQDTQRPPYKHPSPSRLHTLSCAPLKQEALQTSTPTTLPACPASRFSKPQTPTNSPPNSKLWYTQTAATATDRQPRRNGTWECKLCPPHQDRPKTFNHTASRVRRQKAHMAVTTKCVQLVLKTLFSC